MELRRALGFSPCVERLTGFVGLTVAVFLHGDGRSGGGGGGGGGGSEERPSLEGVLYSVCPETGALALLCGGGRDDDASGRDGGASGGSVDPPSLKLVFAHAVEQVYVVPGSQSASEIAAEASVGSEVG